MKNPVGDACPVSDRGRGRRTGDFSLFLQVISRQRLRMLYNMHLVGHGIQSFSPEKS